MAPFRVVLAAVVVLLVVTSGVTAGLGPAAVSAPGGGSVGASATRGAPMQQI